MIGELRVQQGFQDSDDIDHPFSNLSRGSFCLGLSNVFEMKIIEAAGTLLNYLNWIFSQPHRMAHVNTKTHQRIAPLDQSQHVKRGRIPFIAWPVVMDRNANSILFGKFFDRVERSRLWAANNRRHPRVLRVVKGGTDLLLV